jgi:hypothetical protein
LTFIQEQIDQKRYTIEQHISSADAMMRAIGQAGTALVDKDAGASLEMDWGEEVLEVAADAAEEEDDGGLVRTRSETFLAAEQEDYQYTKYIYIDNFNNEQGPFSEDQMRDRYTAEYLNRDTKVSTDRGDW